MKKNIFTVISMCMFLSTCILASEVKNTSEKSIFNGTIGPIMKISQMGDGMIGLLGARIGTTIADMFVIGIEGHKAIAQSKLKINNQEEDVSFGYGGIGAGVRLFPDSLIHLKNYNTFGVGMINLKKSGKKGIVALFEPELNAEVDIMALMRVGAGLSYRIMVAESSMALPKPSLLGASAQIYLEFSWL